MKLHREDRLLSMPHSLVGAIVRIKEPWFPFQRQRFLVYGETMVLRCNVAALASYLNAGLVLAAMAILQLERIGADRKGQELMSETDSKDRNISC